MLALTPENAEARAKLALSLYHLKQFDGAQMEVQNALSTKPDLPEGWNTLGLIFLEKKQNGDAANAFEKAISLKPDYTEARENLARIKEHL
ncbi:MAG TPA: tetratricopeptide repeat protein [Pyrinomonadaceae bacterium]|nr:tetratricopeptide repeat protein [Pyrinomonadaceae bacterium]